MWCSIEGCFELVRTDGVELAVDAFGVEPMRPAKDGDLDLVGVGASRLTSRISSASVASFCVGRIEVGWSGEPHVGASDR